MNNGLLNKIAAPVKLTVGGLLVLKALTGCAAFTQATDLSYAESMITLGELMLTDNDPKNDRAALQMISTYTRMYNKELAREGRDNIIINSNIGSSSGSSSSGNSSSGIPKNVIYDGTTYRAAPGYQWKNPGVDGDFEVISIHIIRNEKTLEPAPGYE